MVADAVLAVYCLPSFEHIAAAVNIFDERVLLSLGAINLFSKLVDGNSNRIW